MIDWTTENLTEKDTRILDLGTGNGHLLFGLEKDGFSSLVGVDYSELSISLCKAIAEKEGSKATSFESLDLLDLDNLTSFISRHISGEPHGFKLLLDKGTYDAISLAKHTDDSKPSSVYVESVNKLLCEDGILLITSCNWTEQELLDRFKPHFALLDRIKYPSFKFGGQTGQKITTLALRKLP